MPVNAPCRSVGPVRPEDPDQKRSPEMNSDRQDEMQNRRWDTADNAIRSAVDRVRPAADRIGAWLAPFIQRVLQFLAPLINRIKETPAARRLRERVAPRVQEARERLPEGNRTRSMQIGAAVAAVGVVGLVIGSATSGPSQYQVDQAAQSGRIPAASPVTPEQVEAAREQGVDAKPEQLAAAAEKKQQNQQPEPLAPVGPPVEGIDVSNHNGTNIDWNKVAADGKKFTFVLATDGTSFTNPQYDAQYHGAKDAGLIAGAYHFARPGSSSAEEQANRFLDTIDYRNDGKTLPPVLDLEVDPKSGGCYGKSVSEMQQWTQTFNDVVKDRTGKDPIIYANPSFWKQCMGSSDFSDHALWLASYGVDEPTVPTGFEDWDFWQYTDKGKVAGIDGSTDLNQFQHGIERLKQLAS